MKKNTLLNDTISAAIAGMGHTEGFAIGDCGLPIPKETVRIDIALKRGTPGFIDTLAVVLEELCVEKVILADELKTASPQLLGQIKELLPNVEFVFIPHERFKEELKTVKCVVRTGECTSFANIILVSGIAF